MRRPRSKLQVSTFPFLAVLLCAMGSLLLLLFVMDRRAKIAARYRVNEELQARQARSKAEEDARQAEWDKAKQALHQTLLDQQGKLDANSESAKRALADASKKLELGRLKFSDLEAHIKSEAGTIALMQLAIDNQRAGLAQADKKDSLSKAELAEAAKELADLELALRRLKALKAHEKDTYSLVPYRGKRGDKRLPIYIECVRNGILIHPDKKLLQAWDLSTPDALVHEIELRNGPLAVQKVAKKGAPTQEEPQGPYVLFLVRQTGIGSYYQAMSALKGYQLDFGYELVDEGWTLDVGGPVGVKGEVSNRLQQRWKHQDEMPPSFLPPPVAGMPIQEGSVGVPSFPIQAPGVATGSSVGGSPGSPLLPPRGNAGLGQPIGVPSGNGNAGTGQPNGAPVSGGVEPAIPRPPSFVPIAKNPPPVPIASSSGSPGVPGLGRTGGTGAAPAPGSAPTGTGTSSDKTGATPSTILSPTGNTSLPNQGGPASPKSAPTGTGVPSDKTGATPGGPDTNPSPTGNTSLPNQGGAASPNSGAPRGHGAGSGTPGENVGDSSTRPIPTFGMEPSKKPAPPSPLSKLLGNKDFIVTIECRTDSVVVTPGGFTYRFTTSNLQETNTAFVETIKNLIARRQASVRPGEPPYRPIIRFHVPNEGLRTYYHVYPLLEALHVAAMTRENVAE